MPADTSIVQITAGDSHSAALDNKGKVYYWGTFRDGSGAIGLTHDGSIQKLPVPLGHHLNVKKIASGKPFLISFVVIILRLINIDCGIILIDIYCMFCRRRSHSIAD